MSPWFRDEAPSPPGSGTGPLGRRGFAVTVLVSAVSGLAGCQGEEVLTTPILVAPAERCLDDDGTGGPASTGFDAFFLDVLEFTGTVDTSLRTSCGPCARGEVPCPLVARSCVCAGPRFDGDGVRDALADVRLEDLDPERSYCVRLVGARLGHGEGEDTGPGVTCGEPGLCDLTAVPDPALGFCSLSDVASLSRAETPILVDETACSPCTAPGMFCQTFLNLTSCSRFGE